MRRRSIREEGTAARWIARRCIGGGWRVFLAVILIGCACAATACNGGSKTQVIANDVSGSTSAARSQALRADEETQGGVPMDDINPPPDEIPEIGTTSDLSDEDWRERLTPAQYRILRTQGTEAPGSGAYDKYYEPGTYHCSACNNPLFAGETKFDSKTGWPSFYQPIEDGRVEERLDESHGMRRTEVVCAHCGGHLGHVFEDGPAPTGLRYCVNSVALYFRPPDSSAVDVGD